jgi:hypothetical protein
MICLDRGINSLGVSCTYAGMFCNTNFVNARFVDSKNPKI